MTNKKIKKILTEEQTKRINDAFASISKDDISLRELDLIHKTKRHINNIWLIQLRIWENKIKNLNK